MGSILFGYRIEKAKAVICEEEAQQIRKTAEEYLSGKSFVQAAEAAGLKRNHGTVRKMLENPAYLGTDFYPQILDEQTFYSIAIERNKRVGWLDRDFQSKRIPAPIAVKKNFRVPGSIDTKYDDPFLQAEYAFSLIEEVK